MSALDQKLAAYRKQIAQVEELLAKSPGNEQLVQLRRDLLEVCELTAGLLPPNTKATTNSDSQRFIFTL